MAQNYAEFMATSDKFGPSNASEMGLGENIYGLEASYPATSCIVEHILDLWYYEIHNYNFRQPNNQSYSDVSKYDFSHLLLFFFQCDFCLILISKDSCLAGGGGGIEKNI